MYKYICIYIYIYIERERGTYYDITQFAPLPGRHAQRSVGTHLHGNCGLAIASRIGPPAPVCSSGPREIAKLVES